MVVAFVRRLASVATQKVFSRNSISRTRTSMQLRQFCVCRVFVTRKLCNLICMRKMGG